MANNYKFKGISLATTAQTSLLTAASGRTIIIRSVRISNKSGNTPDITLFVTDNSASATFNFSRRNMATNKTSDLLTGVKVFEENDSLNITAAHSNMITGVVAILEQDRT